MEKVESSKNKIRKIYVLGPTGSGKSFLAKKLSEILKIKSYDMDDVRFIKKYTKSRSNEKRKKLVDKILKNKKWIIDGRGTDWDRHAMNRADLIIQLKTPEYKRTYRIFKRYLKRRKDPHLKENFFDPFNLVKYSLSYRFGKRTTSHSQISRFLSYNNLVPIIIKNRKELNHLLEKIKNG